MGLARLFYGVVGAHGIGSVDYRKGMVVADIKKAIAKEEEWVVQSTRRIKLFLATRDRLQPDHWLMGDDEDSKCLLQGDVDVPVDIAREYLRQDRELVTTAAIDAWLPDQLEMVDGRYPIQLLVLVDAPEKADPHTEDQRRLCAEAGLRYDNLSLLKRRCTPLVWTWDSEACAKLTFGETDSMLRIPARYLVNSILRTTDGRDLVLYRRCALQEQ